METYRAKTAPRLPIERGIELLRRIGDEYVGLMATNASALY